MRSVGIQELKAIAGGGAHGNSGSGLWMCRYDYNPPECARLNWGKDLEGTIGPS